MNYQWNKYMPCMGRYMDLLELALRCRMHMSCRAQMCGHHVNTVKAIRTGFARAQIHTGRMSENSFLGRDVDLAELAQRCRNFSGAEIEGLVKSAASFALNRQVDLSDLSKPIDEENLKARQLPNYTQSRVTGETPSLFVLIRQLLLSRQAAYSTTGWQACSHACRVHNEWTLWGRR